jgi:hypothetical protein
MRMSQQRGMPMAPDGGCLVATVGAMPGSSDCVYPGDGPRNTTELFYSFVLKTSQ